MLIVNRDIDNGGVMYSIVNRKFFFSIIAEDADNGVGLVKNHHFLTKLWHINRIVNNIIAKFTATIECLVNDWHWHSQTVLIM